MKAPPYYMLPMVEALGGIANALEQGRSTKPGLSILLRMLSIRPADGVASIQAEIQHYARLRRPLGPENFPPGHRIEPVHYADLIARDPGLQYLFLFHQDG